MARAGKLIRINDEDIYRRAKAAAALEGITLGQYIDRALSAAVEQGTATAEDNGPSK